MYRRSIFLTLRIFSPALAALGAFIVSPGAVFARVIVASVSAVFELYVARVTSCYPIWYAFVVVWARILEIFDLGLRFGNLALLAFNLL